MAASGTNSRQGELGDFLRSRRQKLMPKTVGLPVGRRRRTPGLRREEVAELAGIGVDWYIRLEQGRSVSPSTLRSFGEGRTRGEVIDTHTHAIRRGSGHGTSEGWFAVTGGDPSRTRVAASASQ